jgi:hypothetical protein
MSSTWQIGFKYLVCYVRLTSSVTNFTSNNFLLGEGFTFCIFLSGTSSLGRFSKEAAPLVAKPMTV